MKNTDKMPAKEEKVRSILWCAHNIYHQLQGFMTNESSIIKFILSMAFEFLDWVEKALKFCSSNTTNEWMNPIPQKVIVKPKLSIFWIINFLESYLFSRMTKTSLIF